MECKGVQESGVPVPGVPVLIETLWNVKEFHEQPVQTGPDVLIETLWNVKEVHEQPVQTGADRFNSNIVECKG